MSEEIKIITLGDIFKNIETEEKAFKFKDYIKDLQQKVEQLEKENILLKEANNYHQEVIKSMKEPENAHHYHLENIKLRAINNQLENIKKEAIEFTNSHFKEMVADEEAQALLNILNKGDNK